MSDRHTILIVDDDEFMRMLLQEALGEDYDLIEASSGEACIAIAGQKHPKLILLDVEMEGMNGFDTCRAIKNDLDLSDIPVIFVSSHDQIDQRLRGYEAGGEDYIVKPFEAKELQAKVSGLLGKLDAQSQLKQMANYASQTAMTAMSSMSELGSLLQTLQSFNACASFEALAEATVGALNCYGLEGASQVRPPHGQITRTSHGDATPLEASVIGHMAGMDRIVQYRNRLSITYPHVSLLVSNMPVDDPDKCGRLRDHLAVLAESAEVRAASLVADDEARRRADRIATTIQRVTKTLREIDQAQRQSRTATGIAVQELTTQFERAYVQLSLTETQEEFLAQVCREGVARVLDAQLAESGVQDKMSAIVTDLQSML